MNDTTQKQLGTILWDIADTLRGAMGAAQAATFSWERCARETLAVFDEVARGTCTE